MKRENDYWNNLPATAVRIILYMIFTMENHVEMSYKLRILNLWVEYIEEFTKKYVFDINDEAMLFNRYSSMNRSKISSWILRQHMMILCTECMINHYKQNDFSNRICIQSTCYNHEPVKINRCCRRLYNAIYDQCRSTSKILADHLVDHNVYTDIITILEGDLSSILVHPEVKNTNTAEKLIKLLAKEFNRTMGVIYFRKIMKDKYEMIKFVPRKFCMSKNEVYRSGCSDNDLGYWKNMSKSVISVFQTCYGGRWTQLPLCSDT